MRWTPEEHATVEDAAGVLTANELADVLVDRPAYVIHRYCQRKGIALKREAIDRPEPAPTTTEVRGNWAPERIEALKRMWARGDSGSQIANALGGLTRSAVIGKVFRLNLSRSAGANTATYRATAARIKNDRERRAYAEARLIARAARRAAQAAGAPRLIAVPSPPPPPVYEGPMVPLEALHARCCKFPLGDPSSPTFGFCGAPKPNDGAPYCRAHSRLAYQPAPTKTQRAAAVELFRAVRRYA